MNKTNYSLLFEGLLNDEAAIDLEVKINIVNFKLQIHGGGQIPPEKTGRN